MRTEKPLLRQMPPASSQGAYYPDHNKAESWMLPQYGKGAEDLRGVFRQITSKLNHA
jgi:hypothetical protein